MKSIIIQKIKLINIIFGSQKIKIILILQYILFLLINLFFNAFLYTVDVVSNKFHNNGKLDLFVIFSVSIISNIITSIICKLINFSDKIEERLKEIMKIKREFNYLCAVDKFIRILKIRVILFSIIAIIVIFFSFYYIIIFSIVYINSQISLIINYLISLFESLIASIIISIIIAITRKIGIIYLNNYLYNTSKYFYKW